MDLKQSIIKTIAFFDLFDFPLKAEEIQEYLYQYDRPVHIKEIQETLKEMEGVVNPIHDFFVLGGREKIIDTRKARKFIAEKWWGRVRQYMQYVVQVPFVEMVAVCNNLAYDNPSEDSDIDLFIIIREGRMWLARLLITLILQFFGVRRHADKIAGRFCLSFFVTPKQLSLSAVEMKPEDPYLAYWTKWLMPIYGSEMYAQFKNQNQIWLQKGYGLRFSDLNQKQNVFQGKGALRKGLEWMLGGWLGDQIEKAIRKLWLPRTTRHAAALGPEASVVVSDDMLKFHNHDKRKEYFEKWMTIVSQTLSELGELEKQKETQNSPPG